MNTKFRYIFFGLAFAFVLASCNKALVEADGGKDKVADTVTREKKLLLVLVDGAVGVEYKAMALPGLKSLEQNSNFSYDGINNYMQEIVEPVQAWSSIMTGVTKAKHNVSNDISTNNFANYPSFVKRMKGVNGNFKISAIAADASISNNLFSAADEKFVIANNDGAVNAQTKAVLANTTSNLVIAHFNSPRRAGLANSFLASSSVYTDTAKKIDSYITQQISAIRARASYAKEDWLIMVVSTTGADAPGIPSSAWNAFDDKNHNTLYFYYNPRFQLSSYVKPSTRLNYIVNNTFIKSVKGENKSAVAANTIVGNIPDTGSYTMQCKVYFTGIGYFEWPILSKKVNYGNSQPGWMMYIYGNAWSGYNQWGFHATKPGQNDIRYDAGAQFTAVNTWYTLTTVIKKEGAARNVYLYTDGQLLTNAASGNIAAFGDLTSPSPFTVGQLPGYIPSYDGAYSQNTIVTDIRLYNTALSADYISNNYCKVDVTDIDPYKNNLIGFWPATNFIEEPPGTRYFKDEIDGLKLTINGYNGASYNNYTPKVCPPLSERDYKAAPNAIDVATQVYSWFGVPVSPSWNLDGKAWVPNYSNN